MFKSYSWWSSAGRHMLCTDRPQRAIAVEEIDVSHPVLHCGNRLLGTV